MLRTLASWSFRHRWLAFVAWLVEALGIAVAGSAYAGPQASGSLEGSDAAAYGVLVAVPQWGWFGLAGTARVITAAAAIMVYVFGSFVVSDVRALRLFGVGTAAAVLIDAALVRLVLVAATMEPLGSRNRWAPRWLNRILPGTGHQQRPDGPPGVPDAPARPEPSPVELVR